MLSFLVIVSDDCLVVLLDDCPSRLSLIIFLGGCSSILLLVSHCDCFLLVSFLVAVPCDSCNYPLWFFSMAVLVICLCVSSLTLFLVISCWGPSV